MLTGLRRSPADARLTAEVADGKRFAGRLSALKCMRNAPSRVFLVGLLVVALVASGVAPVAGDAPSPSPSIDADRATVAVETTTADSDPVRQIDDPYEPTTATRILIEPTPDRDARWTVSVRYALTGETDRAAFDAASERFLDGEIGPDATLFEGFAREASRNVDRRMQIQEVNREVVVHEDPSSFDVADGETTAVGELRLTFVWTDFLAQDGENLLLGDALRTPDGGTWLVSLAEGQTLEVATPDGYTVTGTSDATDRLSDNAVIVEGPRTFGDDERVAVVYAPAATTAPPWTMLTAAIVVAAMLIAGSIVGYRRMGADAAAEPNGSVAAGGVDNDGGSRVGGGNGGETGSEVAGADAVSDAAEGDGAPEGDGEPEEDLSLLSDEERVERLLDGNGGRMRQADIVAETGWSDAKVSQLLSAMADSNRVEKLRLGRENLISLPDDGEGNGDSERGGDGERDGDDGDS